MNLPQPLGEVLDLARWAPSGDNTQPWRFEIVGPQHVVVHGFDTRDHCVYDLDGHPSQVSIGALLETMRIAATTKGWASTATRRLDAPEHRPTFDVHFAADAGVASDPLAECITRRTVQRRPMRTRALTAQEKDALESAAGPEHRVHWLEGPAARRRTTLLLFRYARMRLTMPEAYEVHRSVIEWNARYSEDRMPDQALGVDPMTAKVMRFVMHSWGRVRFFNAFLAGTWAPRVQMELVPGMACAAHFVIEATRPPETTDDYVQAGRAAQRFWLAATRLGLQLQPEMTPLIFARYVREARSFSTAAGSQAQAARLAAALAQLIGTDRVARAVFMGRIGAGQAAHARSIRKPLSDLLTQTL